MSEDMYLDVPGNMPSPYLSFLFEEERGMEKTPFLVEKNAIEGLNELNRLKIVLPSDPDWRTENYFRLVEYHRSQAHRLRKVIKPVTRKLFHKGFPALGLWALRWAERRGLETASLSVDSEPEIHWSDQELIRASKVLRLSQTAAQFSHPDPEVMRRVLGLVYDVLRYKNVLGEVLEDIAFFKNAPAEVKEGLGVWLLFYDMICRGFSERRGVMKEEEWAQFKEEGLDLAGRCLWQEKVKIAAGVARLRIRRGAESLAQLLPRRLRAPSRLVTSPIIQGWINVFRIPCEEMEGRLKKLGLTRHVGREALPPLTFSQDHLLPFHFYLRPFARPPFLNSQFVLRQDFILQSRSQCLSGAVVCELMKKHELVGSVAQTHLVALSATGYMAGLLWVNPQLSSQLLLFDAGSRKEDYKAYFETMGVRNVYVLAEDFSEVEPMDPRLEGVVLVVVNPPSSYTAVRDPVELAIAKGGDLTLLRNLTSKTDLDEEVEEDILARQRETLRRALAIPQVQVVVYETFSEFPAENDLLANKVVEEMNKWAAHKHFVESQGESIEEYDPNRPGAINSKEIQVPVCDLFEVMSLPDICPHEKNCMDLENEGVYLGLIMRKKITKLDSKFMISMAEERGLFGSGNKDGRSHDLEKAISDERPSSSLERRLPRTKVNMKRISAQTFCSKLKHVRETCQTMCERSRVSKRVTISRIWWNTLIGHIKFYLKRRIHKIKLYFPRRNVFYSRKRKKMLRLTSPEIILAINNEINN